MSSVPRRRYDERSSSRTGWNSSRRPSIWVYAPFRTFRQTVLGRIGLGEPLGNDALEVEPLNRREQISSSTPDIEHRDSEVLVPRTIRFSTRFRRAKS